MRILSALALLLVARPAAVAQEQQSAARGFEDPVVRRIEGWTVNVAPSLLEKDPEVAEDALRLLEVKLHEIARAQPGRAARRLREVPIWMGSNDEHRRFPCACYHPSEEWLKSNGYDPRKAGAVDILNAGTFVEWSREQPWMVLHELAHAFHHQVLGYEDPEIVAAYEHAKAKGLYDSVLRASGQREGAYARVNEQEYFAELSEAYFGTNDFYPFVKAELKEHDPVGEKVLRFAWYGGGTSSAPVLGGRASGTRTLGAPWERVGNLLHGSGPGTLLEARSRMGRREFEVSAHLSLDRMEGTAASFVLDGDSHFGFDGRGRSLFVEGPLFAEDSARLIGPAPIEASKEFRFELWRRSGELIFRLDGQEVYRTKDRSRGPLSMAFRPWRNTMRIREWRLRGKLVSPPRDLSDQEAVFTSGTDGYHTFRIPALAVARSGALLAFAEGRKDGSGDSGDIDLVMKRSTDGGITWDKSRVIWDDEGNTCGNPCPVVDRETGVVWLLMTRNLGQDHEREIIDQTSEGTRTVWVTASTDDGLTWSAPREITRSVKQEDWTWYATGPGSGIQLRDGRFVIPCDHIEAGTKDYYSHVIFSDDHGLTWQLGGSAGPQTNECTVVERADGSLLLNMRNYDRSKRERAISVSRDRGMTWSPITHDAALPEPICQASVVGIRSQAPGAPGGLLFCNPASPASRRKMTVRVSWDDGKTWPVAKLLHDGPSAYSSLAAGSDGRLFCLYEKGELSPYETLTLARFHLDWLTTGTSSGR